MGARTATETGWEAAAVIQVPDGAGLGLGGSRNGGPGLGMW